MPASTDTCDWCGRVRKSHKMTTRVAFGGAGVVHECAKGCKPGGDSLLNKILSTPIEDLRHGRVYDPSTRTAR